MLVMGLLETLPEEKPQINEKDAVKEQLVGSRRLRVHLPEAELIGTNRPWCRILPAIVRIAIDEEMPAETMFM